MSSSTHELFEAIRTGDKAYLAARLSEQPDLAHVRSAQGISPVLWAYYTGQTDLLPTLLTAQPRLDIHDLAALGDGTHLRALLASESAQASAYSSDGFTALHYAAFFSGDVDVATALLEAGVEVDAVARNAQKVTPLHSAVAGRHTAIIHLLLAHGANVNARQQGGETALMGAAQNGDEELVAYLLTQGADPNLMTDDGRNAADVALEAGHTALASILREKLT